MIGLSMAEQLRRAVMPPDLLELQEEYNELRRRRIAHEREFLGGFAPLEGGLLNVIGTAVLEPAPATAAGLTNIFRAAIERGSVLG